MEIFLTKDCALKSTSAETFVSQGERIEILNHKTKVKNICHNNVIEVKNRKRIVKEKPTNPFSESFIQVWEQWKDYKKTSHRFSYKTIDSENIALAQLAKTSQGNEEFAIEMIHHSIAQGYKGIFAPDKSKQQTNGTKIQLTSKFEQWLNKA